MDSEVVYPNVYIEGFLPYEKPLTLKRKRTVEVKWKCSDFVLKLLEEGFHADVEFVTYEEGYVDAHSIVLICVCPALYKEYMTSYDELGISTAALNLFLFLLYTTNEGDHVVLPEFSDAIDENFEELFEAVMRFNVEKRLGLLLLPALARQLTPENCWYYYRDSLHAKHLPFKTGSSEICYNYILGNYAEVITSSSFAQIMKRNIEEVQRIMIQAESQASRQEALRCFRAIANFEPGTDDPAKNFSELRSKLCNIDIGVFFEFFG